jgi:acyl carrier protein
VLDPKADLRRALDIDSLDFLNVLTAIHARLGINVPEKDYGKLVTFAGAVDYLEKAMQQPGLPRSGT